MTLRARCSQTRALTGLAGRGFAHCVSVSHEFSTRSGLSRWLRCSTGEVIAASANEEAGSIDAAGFVARVEPVLPSAYRLAAAMLRSSADADDAVQEALFKAWATHQEVQAGGGHETVAAR